MGTTTFNNLNILEYTAPAKNPTFVTIYVKAKDAEIIGKTYVKTYSNNTLGFENVFVKV